jgi:hypothetical protein
MIVLFYDIPIKQGEEEKKIIFWGNFESTQDCGWGWGYQQHQSNNNIQTLYVVIIKQFSSWTY